MSRNAIELINLTKSYKMYEKPFDRVKEAFNVFGKKYSVENKVLEDINLTIEEGEVIGIVGTNGAGKSTLLKTITGVVSPTSGDIKVNGKVSALLELGTGFNPEFTGIKNIFLNGTMMGFTHEEIEEKLQGIIDFADIGDFINQPVKIYSSGMFARLAFAVAINVEPDILIVDEALSVGDLRFQIKCMDKMKEMMDGGVTVLFVSHDINAIRRLCTQCLWLKDGKICAFGETNNVCDMYMDYLKLADSGDINKKFVEKSYDNEDLEFSEFQPASKEIIAQICGVRLMNNKGKKVESINWKEPFIVEVYYDVFDEDIEEPVLGVALKRIDEEYICGLNTMLDNRTIPWKYGRNCYKLVYDNGIRVLGGEYFFDVALFDKTATVPIQYCSRIIEFLVTAEYVGEGICILPHEWRN